MKLKLRLFIVIPMLCVLLAFAVSAEIPEITPDSVTGKYELTYSGAEPFTNYVAVALEGIFEEDYLLDLTDLTDKNIVYYNSFMSDTNGDIAMEFVTSEYTDSTLFIGGAGMETPAAVCYLLQGEAETIADFEIIPGNTTYYVGGIGTAAEYVSYTVEAQDSFGYDAAFPYEDAERTLVDYEGNKMSFVEGSNAIQLENMLEEGVYSFSITYGGITKTANFEVKHRPSVPKQMTVTLNGQRINKINVSCVNTTEGSSFNPEKVSVQAVIVDQYLNPIQLDYVFDVKKPDNTKEKIESSTGVYEFVPVNILNVDDTETYTVKVSAPDADDFKSEITITVTGVTNYTGDALRLFQKIVEAKDYAAKLDSGEIVISEENGNDVHYSKSWVSAEQAEALRTAIENGEVMLSQIDEGTATPAMVSKAVTAMNSAVSGFDSKIKEGNYKPIEVLKFEKTEYRLADGKSGKLSDEAGNSFVVTATPSRPSEKPVYYSENPVIATVNEKTGAVTAKSAGVTRIYARNADNTVSAYYTLTVYTPISSLKYSEASVTVIAGQKFTPGIKVLPEDHSDVIEYSSNNSKVAKVDKEEGTITTVGGGSATITAKSGSGKSTSISIIAIEPEFLITKECIAKPGTVLTLPVEVLNINGADKIAVTARFNQSIFKFNGANDGGLAKGYVETVDDGAGKVVATWENVSFEGADDGKLIDFVLEVLPGVSLREYDIKFTVEAYTKDGDKITWSKSNATTTVDVGEKDTYTVTVNAGNGGTAYGEGEYKFGQEATVRAYPSGSYSFAGWYSGSSKLSTDKIYTFVVTEEITLLAKFTKVNNGIAGGGGGGTGGGGGGIGGGGPQPPQVVVKQVSPITANVANGVVPYGTQVTLSTTTIGAKIYYTLDGTTPTASSIPYTAPIVLKSESNTISAVAVKAGMNSSNIARFTYRIEEFPQATPVVKKLKDGASDIKYAPVSSPYFRPNDAATRYEVMEMLSALFDVSGGEADIEPFSDVSDSYKTLVETYAKAGIINGYPDGTFGGYKSITRAEIVKILSVLMNMDVTGDTSDDVTLTDISGHWAENNIKAFVAAGYIVGYPEGDFRPNKAVTRAEAVTILNRISGVQKIDYPNQYFIDVQQSFWGYSDIMNAANIPVTGNEADDAAEE